MTTPRLTQHARDRCEEMRVSTKVAKNIVREHTVAWTNAEGRTVATSDRHPEVTVVYAEGSPPTVLTVLWRTAERYDRATFQPA